MNTGTTGRPLLTSVQKSAGVSSEENTGEHGQWTNSQLESRHSNPRHLDNRPRGQTQHDFANKLLITYGTRSVVFDNFFQNSRLVYEEDC